MEINVVAVTEMVDTMKHEIIFDVKTGQVPNTVTSFSELHDYVDANTYERPDEFLESVEGSLDDEKAMAALVSVFNNASEIIDGWIKSGVLKSVQINKEN